jgi:hypothetical protein
MLHSFLGCDWSAGWIPPRCWDEPRPISLREGMVVSPLAHACHEVLQPGWFLAALPSVMQLKGLSEVLLTCAVQAVVHTQPQFELFI